MFTFDAVRDVEKTVVGLAEGLLVSPAVAQRHRELDGERLAANLPAEITSRRASAPRGLLSCAPVTYARRLRWIRDGRMTEGATVDHDMEGAAVNLMGSWEDTMATEFARTTSDSHSEGRVAKAIEDQTAKLPSDAFLWMAVGSMAASATLQAMGNRHVSLFIGQWAPTFLIFGLDSKLVKQLGSDRTENAV